MKLRHLVLLCFCLIFQSVLFAQPEVYFDIRNNQIVNNTLSFDVYMRASQSGTYHSRGQVYLFYNPAAFGSTVVVNNNVTVTELDLLTEPDIFGGTKYLTVNIADNGNRVAVTWQMVYQAIPASSLTHTVVPDTFAPLYHFEMEVLDPAASPGITFDYSLMGAQQFYLAPNTTTELQYTFPLPVSWTYFTAEKILDRDVELRWGTEEETNNVLFEIEKDRGDGKFEVVGEVAGAGTVQSFQEYVFVDRTGMGNRNAYRIKQIDLNGNFSYSETLEVVFDYFGSDKFEAFPVPLQHKLTLLAEAKEEIPYQYRITDIYGKVFLSGTLGAYERATDIDVAHLTPGSYLLVILHPDRQKYIIRLTK
jgi:hypothetical protein